MNTGGPALEKTLLDWYAGQALAGLCSSWYDRNRDDPETQRGHGPTLISQSAYTHAEAMLAEKERREATGKGSLTVPDHSPEATKMIELQAANRELVEALDVMSCWVSSYVDHPKIVNARAILANHKGAA